MHRFTLRTALGSRRFAMLAVTSTLIWLAPGCASPDPEPQSRAVESESLNLRFEDVPDALVVTANREDRIELQPRAATGDEPEPEPRTLWVEVTPTSEFGIDLVAEVNALKAEYEALDQGAYSGAQEIVVPGAGSKAYYARGQYDLDSQRVEELRILFVHPSENRLVVFHSRYPHSSDDTSRQRLDELFAWVGEVSALRSWEELSGGDSTAAPDSGTDAEEAAQD